MVEKTEGEIEKEIDGEVIPPVLDETKSDKEEILAALKEHREWLTEQMQHLSTFSPEEKEALKSDLEQVKAQITEMSEGVRGGLETLHEKLQEAQPKAPLQETAEEAKARQESQSLPKEKAKNPTSWI